MGARFSFNDARVLGALGLLLVLGFVFIPRAADAGPGRGDIEQRQNALAGAPAGTAWPVPVAAQAPLLAGPVPSSAPALTPPPTPTIAPTPSPTPEATPEVAADGFGAQVMACRSIAGASCQGELASTEGLASFVALVLLENTTRGDVIEAVLIGEAQTFSGGGYTVGGGDGWYYSTFAIGGMPAGTYALVVTRNGAEVDRTELVIG